MNRERRYVTLVVDRKAALLLSAVLVVVGMAGILSSQQLSMTATYPIPAGVYNQIVTTGNSGGTPADTTLNRNAGNTILVPPTNAGGNVGIGTASPGSKLVVAGGVQLGDDPSACTAAKAGTLRWSGSQLQHCAAGAWTAPLGPAGPKGDPGTATCSTTLSSQVIPAMNYCSACPGGYTLIYCDNLSGGGESGYNVNTVCVKATTTCS